MLPWPLATFLCAVLMSNRSNLLEWPIACVVAIGLAVLLTYPVAFKLADAGRVDTFDGDFAIWNVAWVARALVREPLGVYDANIFHPHRETLAYSEANIGAGALAVPAYWLTRNAYVAHNVVFLLSFVLSGLAGYALVRHLTLSRSAASVAGISFAFCPYVFAHTAHIQLLMTAGLPLSLLALHRFVGRRTVGTVLGLAIAIAVQALSCAYYGIFAAMLVTGGVLFFGGTRGLWKDWRYWGSAAVSAAIAFAVVWPFFLPYLRLQDASGFGRTIGDAARWSADWRAYIASSALAHEWILEYTGPGKEVLFPGLVASIFGLLGVIGALPAFRRRTDRPPLASRLSPSSDVVLFYMLVLVASFWASFGPDAGLYRVAHELLPMFSFLRAPSRLGIVVVLALSVLAGVAIAKIVQGRRRGPVIAAALCVAAVAELWAIPLPWYDAPPVDAAYRTLARLPYGPTAEFPFYYERIDFPRHAFYMRNSTYHWMPLVNGYSDFIPAAFRLRVVPLSSFPNPESFAIFQGLRLRYAIFHLDLYEHRARERLVTRLEHYRDYLRPIVRENDVWLYEIVGWPPPGR
jgi:hypothetical protein